MKIKVALLLLVLCFVASSTAFAELGDKKAAIIAKYGDYRMVVDDRGRVWTKADWEAGGKGKDSALTYIHYFMAKDVRVQLDVMYFDYQSDPRVKAQRFTPDWSIQIKDLKNYFPDLFALVTAPEAKVFNTNSKMTSNFLDERSPVILGAVVAREPAGKKGYYTLVLFNIKGEGTLIKDPKQITPDTYISEIVLIGIDKLDAEDSSMRLQKNIFK